MIVKEIMQNKIEYQFAYKTIFEYNLDEQINQDIDILYNTFLVVV